jgi:hypothetical protein
VLFYRRSKFKRAKGKDGAMKLRHSDFLPPNTVKSPDGKRQAWSRLSGRAEQSGRFPVRDGCARMTHDLCLASDPLPHRILSDASAAARPVELAAFLEFLSVERESQMAMTRAPQDETHTPVPLDGDPAPPRGGGVAVILLTATLGSVLALLGYLFGLPRAGLLAMLFVPPFTAFAWLLLRG